MALDRVQGGSQSRDGKPKTHLTCGISPGFTESHYRKKELSGPARKGSSRDLLEFKYTRKEVWASREAPISSNREHSGFSRAGGELWGCKSREVVLGLGKRMAHYPSERQEPHHVFKQDRQVAFFEFSQSVPWSDSHPLLSQ